MIPLLGALIAAAPQGPVVVELFTSQGCSSCPSADRLFSRLASDERLVLLAFHVDYWNKLGWPDPFSRPSWSERQEQYARAMASNRLYTPQMVVDGASHAVGSSDREVKRLIAEALESERAVDLAIAAGPVVKGRAEVTVTVREVREAVEGRLLVAVWQSGLETKVTRGENAGRHLVNDHVVRTLEEWQLGPKGIVDGATAKAMVTLDPAWGRGPFGVAALLAHRENMRVLGAASVKLP